MGDLSHTSASREGVVATPIPQAPFVPGEASLKQTSLTLLGGYRAVDQSGLSIDLLGGLRTFWIRTALAAPAIGIARAPGIDIVDPIVAVRVNGRLGDGWSVLAYGDLGGFGAGSEMTAQFSGTINARIARSLWLSAGYRYLTVDYRNARARADLRLGGPIVGATFTF